MLRTTHVFIDRRQVRVTFQLRDAFGHVKLDKVNPGAYFAKQFAAKIGAEKVMVQKSGYYSRAAAPSTSSDRERSGRARAACGGRR